MVSLKKITKVSLLFTLVAAAPAIANNKLSMDVHITSYHTSNPTYYDQNKKIRLTMNENNFGLGLKYNLSKSFNDNFQSYASIGAYNNSYRKTTSYIGYGLETTDKVAKGFGLGLDLLITKGYESTEEKHGVPVFPAILPYLRFGSESSRFSVKTSIIPGKLAELVGAVERSSNIFTLSVNYKFGSSNKPNL